MQKTIIEENERKLFFKYLWPSMLSMLAVSAYSFVDTFVVGQAIGAQAVAAMGLGTPVVSFLYALGFLCGSGGAVNYAVKMSMGEKEEANKIYTCSFITALILWAIIGIFGNIYIVELARFLGATSGNIALTVEYLRWIISLSGFLVMDLVTNNFMRNEGHPNVSMAGTVTGTGLNIVLDFIFVMGFKWGMAGAASATCIASIISVTINISYAYIKKTNLIPRLRKDIFSKLVSMVQIGFSSFIMEAAVAIISVVFLNFAGKYYGDQGVSAFSVLITFNLVVYSLLDGVTQAVQPLVSASYGCGRNDRIRKFLLYGLGTALVVGIGFFAVAEIIPKPLTGLFVIDDQEILVMAARGLQYYAFSYIFMSISIVAGIYFQAKTKPAQSIIILLGRSAVFPIALVYGLSLFMHGLNLWIAIPLGEAVAAILSVILLLIDKKSNH